MSNDEFKARVERDEFVEWEEVYAGTCYGTLKSEMERIWAKGNVIIFDVDVMGGINLKRLFGDDACSVFIMPPSVEELERRLRGRGTDAEDVIMKRIAKAEFEISKASEFDYTVVNDVLEDAVNETAAIISNFLK
jgi:guanylate kinase